jgi:small-conductance mechanosensitive channel
MNSHTINYTIDTAEKGLILHTTVTIGYDAPWKDVTNALLLAADRTDLLEKDPKPFVHQTSLDDFYVSYELNVYTKQANKQAHIYSDLHQNIQDTFNEAGIEIMSPHYRAARDGNMTTIPANYLDKDYTAPAFNVSSRKE